LSQILLIPKKYLPPIPPFPIFSLILLDYFFKKEKFKINTLTTYQSILSISIAILLLNASVFKEIHTFFLHDHHHDHHHEQEVEHDDICNHSTHMHEIEHVVVDCSICAFHFSSAEKIVYTFPNSIIFPTTKKKYFYTENISFQNADAYPMLRGPPKYLF
jgi:hypothetical protein